MKRFFAFGCSFTQSAWPSWADILAQKFDYYENWARAGGGNQFIFNSIIECHKRNELTPEDTVIVMWSSIGREDRYLLRNCKGWVTPGSIFNQTYYDENFVNTMADPYWYLLRDTATISAARMVLNYIGCKWHFLSIVPIEYYNDGCYNDSLRYDRGVFDEDSELVQRVANLYREDLAEIKPSVYDVVFNRDWYSRNHLKPTMDDLHPTPVEHLIYLKKVLPQYEFDDKLVNKVEIANQQLLNGEYIDLSNWKICQLNGTRF